MRMIKYILPWFVLCGAAIADPVKITDNTPKTD